MVRNKMARMPWLFMAIALFAALGVTLAAAVGRLIRFLRH